MTSLAATSILTLTKPTCAQMQATFDGLDARVVRYRTQLCIDCNLCHVGRAGTRLSDQTRMAAHDTMTPISILVWLKSKSLRLQDASKPLEP